MPVYVFECPEHGNQETIRTFAECSNPHYCISCGVECGRVYLDFYYEEDRCRFSRNPRTGTDHSDMLGRPYPKDRKERDATYKQMGIEPVTKMDVPDQWKRAAEYAKHLNNGGEKLSAKEEAKLVDKPDLSGIKSVVQQMRESDAKFITA